MQVKNNAIKVGMKWRFDSLNGSASMNEGARNAVRFGSNFYDS